VRRIFGSATLIQGADWRLIRLDDGFASRVGRRALGPFVDDRPVAQGWHAH
jgi:hypothetical protein